MLLTPNTLKDTHLVRNTAEDSGSNTGHSNTNWCWQTTFFKEQEICKATYHLTRRSTQLDYVLMNTALFKHCKDAETTGHIDMNSDHRAGMARVELLIDHKTQQTSLNKQRVIEDSRINRSEHTINVYQAHQEHAFNTNNPNWTTNQATLAERNSKLEDTMTVSASTTQNEQPHDNAITTDEHTETLRHLIQKRNLAPTMTDRQKHTPAKSSRKRRGQTKTTNEDKQPQTV